MSSAAFQTRLRLVGGEDAVPLSAARSATGIPTFDRDQLAVVKENRLAAHAGDIDSAHIDPRDPRWILAMQTRARLQGTMLTPERREQLLHSGRELGLRPFEANLVIAVVQDQARRQRPLRLAGPTIGLIGVGAAAQNRRQQGSAWWWLAAIVGAAVAAAAAIRWIFGG